MLSSILPMLIGKNPLIFSIALLTRSFALLMGLMIFSLTESKTLLTFAARPVNPSRVAMSLTVLLTISTAFGNIVLNASISICTTDVPSPTQSVSVKNDHINSIAAGIRTDAASRIALPKLVISSPALVINSAAPSLPSPNPSAKPRIISAAVFAVSGMPVIRPSIRLVSSVLPCSISVGAPSWMNVPISPGIALMTFPTIGTRLSNRNVPAADASCAIAGPTSPPVESIASTFCALAFMAPNEPEKVVAASSAATPVRPRSSCMT